MFAQIYNVIFIFVHIITFISLHIWSTSMSNWFYVFKCYNIYLK